ncbi:MAG: aldehyde dehydrogenase family protein, partial [Gaiellaceae bacterium]
MTTLDDVPNLIDGEDRPAVSGAWIDKYRPFDGTLLCRVARSGVEDAAAAVAVARRAQPGWAERTPVERGDLVRDIALALRERREELSAVVSEAIGKPMAVALAETDAAIEMGFFVAGEGRRSYGRTMPA